METLIAILTNQTCGDACWHAREDICRCSCGGKNHGCLRGKDGVMPERTSRINGAIYKLVAVGNEKELEKQAQAINKASGINYLYAHKADKWGAPARLKCATNGQIQKWPELTAWRGKSERELYSEGKPYLLWQESGGQNALA